MRTVPLRAIGLACIGRTGRRSERCVSRGNQEGNTEKKRKGSERVGEEGEVMRRLTGTERNGTRRKTERIQYKFFIEPTILGKMNIL